MPVELMSISAASSALIAGHGMTMNSGRADLSDLLYSNSPANGTCALEVAHCRASRGETMANWFWPELARILRKWKRAFGLILAGSELVSSFVRLSAAFHCRAFAVSIGAALRS